jgi:hypothetical protein
MPNKIEVMKVIMLEYDIYFDSMQDYVAFAYPGMYAGLGENMSEALLMAQLRFAAGRRTFFEARKDATERDWDTYSTDREAKFKEVYSIKGVSDDSCWVFGGVDKTTKKGNT